MITLARVGISALSVALWCGTAICAEPVAPVKFTQAPAVKKAEGKTTVSFAVSAKTDV